MTIYELYDNLIKRFCELPEARDIMNERVCARADSEAEPALMPWNYVPFKDRRPEYCVRAYFRDACGEAYTEAPSDFEGSVREALAIPPSEDGINAVTVAVINAVMNCFGYCAGNFPADFDERRLYTDALYQHVTEHYGRSNIVLVGYDGYIVKKFVSEELDFWTMDRDPDNISQDRFKHIVVNSGRLNRESCFAWGRIFVVTGSTLCNGTIVQYLDQGKDLLFYGITIAGAATLLKLPWFQVKRKSIIINDK